MRQELLKKLDTEVQREIDRHQTYISQAVRAKNIAKRIIENLSDTVCEKLSLVWVEGITEEIRFVTEDHKVVHEISKLLGVDFKKKLNTAFGDVEYTGRYGTTTIVVSGVTSIPRCRITKKKVTVTEEKTVYEIVCH